MKKKLFLSVMISFALSINANAQEVIALEDFDGNAVNLISSTNVFPYIPPLNSGSESGSSTDFAGVTSSSASEGTGGPVSLWDDSENDNSGFGVAAQDNIGIANSLTTAFFGLHDADGIGGPDFDFASWSFDVSEAVSLTAIKIDLAAFGTYEAGDGFSIEAQLDGGGFQTIFSTDATLPETIEYRPFESGNAPSAPLPLQLFIDGNTEADATLINASLATGAFDTFTSTLFAGAVGDVLEIRVNFGGGGSSNEAQGIDNISIEGETETIILGDINCDGEVNLFDIAPFVGIITSNEFNPKADINGDGEVNLFDISGFVSILTGA